MSVNSNPGNASASSGVVHKSQLFTANGTWNKPTKYIPGTCRVTGIGGGGSGNIAAAPYGGDGGQFVYRKQVDISSTGSVAITIGAGGTGATGSPGNNGGTTSFGSLLSVSGGNGGVATVASTGGAKGGRDHPTPNVPLYGQDNPCPFGGNGGVANTADTEAGGGGGLVLDDSGTAGGDVSVGQGGQGYGAGGGAASAGTSGAGANGALLVEWQEYA